jgi:LuxR family maltose regulon positive regulatory protein
VKGIERCKRALAELPETNVEDRARIFAVLGNLFAQQGNVKEAEAALLRCRLLARELGSWPIQLVDMNTSALCLLACGELLEAETLLQRVLATGDEWHDLPVVYAHLLLAKVYLDQHRHELAEQLLERALELADRLSARVHVIRAHRMQAELAWARHDAKTALSELELSIAAGNMEGFGIEVGYSRTMLALIWIRQGNPNLARGWAAELDLNLDRPPEFGRVAEYLVALELLAHDGQTGRALAALDLSIAEAQSNGHRHNVLNMLLLKSMLLTSQGKTKDSSSALGTAIEIGAGSGYVRPFLDFNVREDQLQALSVSSKHARYIRHLLEQMRSDRQRGDSPEARASPLSKRQTEIMQLVAAGYSNRDIADQLFISEQTVKKHLSTTFMRLEVSSRTQAIDACRRMNVL